MNIEILGTGAFESALVQLNAGEEFVSESGAMYRASGNMNIDVTTKKRGGGGGLLGGLKRLLAGEKFFFSTYSTTDGGAGEVGIAPTHQGEVHVIDMDGSAGWLCAGGSYLGNGPEIEVDTKFQGLKGFLTGEAPVFLHCTGTGPLVVTAFGRIVEMEVTEELIVDTGHVVAYQDTLEYSLSKVGGSWIKSWLSGEGIVMKFNGQGKILTQSHNPDEFGNMLGPMLPDR